MVIFVRSEPTSVATRPFLQRSASLRTTQRVFNALPSLQDGRGLPPQPELLASLPALNTDSWKVFPDGRMQTIYTLRPNLTWQDGVSLTADDFVFAWRVYASPELGFAGQPPMSVISDVATSDREHFVIHWKGPYPDADALSQDGRELPALPQHILGSAFEQVATSGRDSVANHPFWSQQYVGLGPYRIQRWEVGSFIDAVRFERYVLGAPKIARIQLRFSSDQNVVMASLLAGEAHAATESSIPNYPEALMQQWDRTRAGRVFSWPSSYRAMMLQLRPELANPRAILAPRIRKAIAYAVDKQAVSDAVYAGQAVFADTPVWKGSAWGGAIDDSIPVYPMDPRASENLMNEVGFNKGSDRFYRATDGQLTLEIATTESPDAIRELPVMADRLQAAGYHVEQRVIAAALSQDGQLRSTFPAVQITGTFMGEVGLEGLSSTQIPTPSNRWIGLNRGGWASPDFDGLLDTFKVTLAHGDRLAVMRQMLRAYGESLPWISLFFPAQAFAQVTELKGPAPVVPEASVAWNIYEWEFR
ncbi:MAG TPA: ABC transporter substrate-binding protein [Chloroflexota bacterium]